MDSETSPDPFALLDQLGDAIVVVDHEWRITAQNAAASRIGRMGAADPTPGTLWGSWPRSLTEPLANPLRMSMRDRVPMPACQLHARPENRWFAVSAMPVASGLAIVARDISAERQQAAHDRALQELTAALSAAIDPAEAASAIIERALPALGANAGNVYLLSEDGRHLVSVAAIGYDAATLTGARLLPLGGPAMMAEVARSGQSIIIGDWRERVRRYPHHRDVHAREGDRAVVGLPLNVEGRTIGALSLAFPTDRSFDDEERRFMATVADLCAQALARTRLYEALRRSEAQARLVTDRAPTFLAHIDADYRYLYVNRSFAERLGLTPEEVIGKRVPEIIGEAAFAVVRDRLDMALAGNEIEFEAMVPYAVLGPRYVQIAYGPDRDEHGQTRGVIAVITDTTERRHSELAREILADAGAVLGATLDASEILRQIGRLTVPSFADRCVTWLVDDGTLRQVSDIGGEAVGTPSLPPPLDISSSMDGAPRRPTVSASPLPSITVPLLAQDRAIGAIQFALFDPARRFTLEEFWLAEELGRRCATALESSRLYHSLQESEAHFRQLADAMPAIAWVVGPTGNELDYVNPQWIETVGAPLEPGTTPLVNDRVHPDDRRRVKEAWQKAVTRRTPFATELRLRAADQSYRWFLYRGEPVIDATGKVTKWFGAATDITDMKRVERAQRFLAELSSTLAISLDPAETLRRVARLVIPTLADYCFVDMLDRDNQLRRVAWAHVQPRMQRLLDRKMRLLIPDTFARNHHVVGVVESGEPSLVPEVTDAWMQEIAFSEEHLAFIRALGPRSRLTVPLRARGRTLGALTLCYSDVSGRRYGPGSLDLARDVAERIALAVDNAQLYVEAREADATVRRLLDAGVVGIVVAREDAIIEANDHFLELVGYTRDELAGGRLRWSALTPPGFAALDASAIAELEALGVSTPYEKECIRRDGTRVPILTGAALLEQEPLRWIGFILDLTEQKRGEEEWRAFIDATAHDLRNPLTSVLGQTQLMQRRLRRDGVLAPDEAHARLATIAASSVRAAGLIDDLIDTARLRAGQPLELRPEPVDLVTLARSCADEASRVGPSHQVRVEASEPSLKIVADEPRIERVVRNMLDNAIKFSPEGGDVIVRVWRDERPNGSWATVAIEDQGIGIPAADLAHVFDRFRRGGNVEGRIHGSGIGLTGAKQIVAQHGGEISVESVEGEGSTFTLALPLTPHPPA